MVLFRPINMKVKDGFVQIGTVRIGFQNLSNSNFEELPARKVWLTSWLDDAEATFQCGWETIMSDQIDEQWKFESAKTFLKKNSFKKVVWVDDELYKWCDRLPELDVELFTVIPKIEVGLAPKDVQNMKDFLLSD